MTVLPDAPGFEVFEHTPSTPLAFLRWSGDPSRFGWYVIGRPSRCLVDVSGPYETELGAREAGLARAAAREAVQAERAARLEARASADAGLEGG